MTTRGGGHGRQHSNTPRGNGHGPARRDMRLNHVEGQTGAGEGGGAQMVRARSGDQLPKAIKGHTTRT